MVPGRARVTCPVSYSFVNLSSTSLQRDESEALNNRIIYPHQTEPTVIESVLAHFATLTDFFHFIVSHFHNFCFDYKICNAEIYRNESILNHTQL